jgi:putative transposase
MRIIYAQSMKRGPCQLSLDLPARGGKRRGAGRKAQGGRAGVSHKRRPALAARFPVHVTLRVKAEVWSLRSRRSFRRIAAAFRAVRKGRRTFRIAEYAILGNHLHLIVEANDRGCLTRGMQALEIRVAKALNKMMERHGPVFADRYHAHILRTPTEVANALRYVRGNFSVHAARQGDPVLAVPDEYSSAALVNRALPHGQDGPLVSPPGTWLLSTGFRLGRRQRAEEASGVTSSGAAPRGRRAARPPWARW